MKDSEGSIKIHEFIRIMSPTKRRFIGELDGGLKEGDGEPAHKHKHSQAALQTQLLV